MSDKYLLGLNGIMIALIPWLIRNWINRVSDKFEKLVSEIEILKISVARLEVKQDNDHDKIQNKT